MSLMPPRPLPKPNTYPTSDGRPVAETDRHRQLMVETIAGLQHWYAPDPNVYVSGNLLLFYQRGNKRRHLSPDVFVVLGVPKHERLNYLVWEEGKGPDFIVELTSSSTRHADTTRKMALYRDRLRVREYFLFDPFADYLDPPFQGYRLQRGVYVPIPPVQGRLPSKVTGLHLERAGSSLRLYDPVAAKWLPTPEERANHAEAEVERLRQELAALRQRNGGAGNGR